MSISGTSAIRIGADCPERRQRGGTGPAGLSPGNGRTLIGTIRAGVAACNGAWWDGNRSAGFLAKTHQPAVGLLKVPRFSIAHTTLGVRRIAG